MKEALEFIASHNFDGADDKAIALMAKFFVYRAKEALAQLAQEPVAQWQKRHRLWTEGAWENAEEHDAKRWRDKAQDWEIRALYTTPQPRPWVGLTDEEFDEIWRMDLNNKDIMDKTITKLKELNT